MSSAMVAPSPSSTLVNVADGAELRLVRLVSQASSVAPDTKAQFAQSCQASISQGDIGQLLSTVLAFKDSSGSPNPALVAGMANVKVVSDDKAASVASLVSALINRVSDPAKASQLLGQICDAISGFVLPQVATTNAVAAAAIRRRQVALMATFYNMCSDNTQKIAVLAQIVRLVGSSSAPGAESLLEAPGNALHRLFTPTSTTSRTPQIVALLDQWNVAPAARRELYQSVADGAANTTTKQRFAVLLVATYDSDATVDANAMKYAKAAAIGAIQDPIALFDEQRDMLSLPAIKALKSSDSKLYALLEVFQQKQLADYEALAGGNALDASWGLDADSCLSNIRILTLCTIASSNDVASNDNVLPYSTIAKSLSLADGGSDGNSSEVETWIIKAMNSGLLQAKMDQLNKVLIVERAVLRKFEMEQWKQLQTKLQSWKSHVQSVLAAYQQQQVQQQQ